MATDQPDTNPDTQSEMPESGAATSTRPSGKSSLIVRCILFGILIVGVVLLVIDTRARSTSKKFHTALVEALDKYETVYDSEVHELAGKKPDKTYREKDGKGQYYEEYTWRGGLRSYTVHCCYSGSDKKVLFTVSLNEPLK